MNHITRMTIALAVLMGLLSFGSTAVTQTDNESQISTFSDRPDPETDEFDFQP